MMAIKKAVTQISGQTMIPLGLALSAIGGGGFWLASLCAKVEAADRTTNRALDIAEKVDRRVARIEGFLDRLEKRFQGEGVLNKEVPNGR